MSLKEAAESAENALGTLDQAEKRLDRDDPLHERFAEARRALREALEWTRRELGKQQADAEARAKGTLEQAGDTERDLAERARKLSEEPGGREGALPQSTAERIGRAGSIMEEAARELAAGHGDRAVQLQREAQRLLEQARPGRSNEPESKEERGDSAQRGEPSKAMD